MKAIFCTINNNILGIGDKLPHDIVPEIKGKDWEVFKSYTEYNNIVMGRKTWDTMGRKPLGKRSAHYIITRDDSLKSDDPNVVYCTLNEFITKKNNNYTVVIGGAEIYKELLPYCSEWVHCNINVTDDFLMAYEKDHRNDVIHYLESPYNHPERFVIKKKESIKPNNENSSWTSYEIITECYHTEIFDNYTANKNDVIVVHDNKKILAITISNEAHYALSRLDNFEARVNEIVYCEQCYYANDKTAKNGVFDLEGAVILYDSQFTYSVFNIDGSKYIPSEDDFVQVSYAPFGRFTIHTNIINEKESNGLPDSDNEYLVSNIYDDSFNPETY